MDWMGMRTGTVGVALLALLLFLRRLRLSGTRYWVVWIGYGMLVMSGLLALYGQRWSW